MSRLADQQQPVDGRVARRERNIAAVLDVVLEMFAHDMMFPTIEQASRRSGLSSRSLYRYFADPGELIEAAIRRSNDQVTEFAHLPHIGQGGFDRRLTDFVALRLRLHEGFGAMYRATLHNATAHPRVGDELQRNRERMRRQFERQFAPELAALPSPVRAAAAEAGNLLTQMDALDLLRRHRALTVAETGAVLRDGLAALLVRRG
ncbi:MAG TPA: hypothetical protein VIS05_00065 [Ilumatobacter sp.]